MNILKLKNLKIDGIIPGLIVAIVLTVSRIPPGLALVVGIIFGVIAIVVLDESKKEMKFRSGNFYEEQGSTGSH